MAGRELMGDDGSACSWIDLADGSKLVHLSAKKVSIDVKEGVKGNKPFSKVYSSMV